MCGRWGAPLSGAVTCDVIFKRICIGEALGSEHLILEVEHTSHQWCAVRRSARGAVFFRLADRDFHHLAGHAGRAGGGMLTHKVGKKN